MATTMTCPGCGRRLRIDDAEWGDLVCPRCLTELEDPATLPVAVDAEGRGARRPAGTRIWLYSRVAYYGILLLTILCILGLVLSLHTGGDRGNVMGAVLLLAFLFVCLDVLAIIPVGVLTLRWAARPGLEAGAVAARVVLSILILLLSLAAIVVYSLFTCLSVVK